MEKIDKELGIVWTDEKSYFSRPMGKDDCAHVLCLQGTIGFRFNSREYTIAPKEIAIVPRPDLMTGFKFSPDARFECVTAPLAFLYSQLPSNHFGIGGYISLWKNPVVPLSDLLVKRIIEDFHLLGDRLCERDSRFYKEQVGSHALSMIYDLFEAHAGRDSSMFKTQRNTDLVGSLNNLLKSGAPKYHRDVKFYADSLNVTPKYLCSVVTRNTGHSVSHLIDQIAMSMILEALRDDTLSLSQIADEFHFSSLSYFTRYVKKHLGMSPSSYRFSQQPRK